MCEEKAKAQHELERAHHVTDAVEAENDALNAAKQVEYRTREIEKMVDGPERETQNRSLAQEKALADGKAEHARLAIKSIQVATEAEGAASRVEERKREIEAMEDGPEKVASRA